MSATEASLSVSLRGKHTARYLAWGACALAAINAWMYSSSAAGPMLQDDSWYFLDAFVSKALEGSLSWQDLFVQRGAGDHSQPLQKLILLFHTFAFDMDFRIEGLIGTIFGIGFCAILAIQMKCRAANSYANFIQYSLIATLFAVALSLNSTNIFTWSLVTLSYLAYLLGVIFLVGIFNCFAQTNHFYVPLICATLGLLIDEMAIVMIVAAVISILIFGAPQSRSSAVKFTLAAISGIFIARLALWKISSSLGVESAGIDASLDIRGSLLSTESLRGLFIPFGDSFWHPVNFAQMTQRGASIATLASTVFAVALNLYFWVIVFIAWRRRATSVQMALAVFLMLTSYALTLAIVVNRVPEFGWQYLHQPRYVIFYQLSLVACVIAMHWRLGQAPKGRSTELVAVTCIASILLFSQLMLSRAAWKLPPYLTTNYQTAALNLGAIRDGRDPINCPSNITPCSYDQPERIRLVYMLESRGLNIFSRAFQLRNRLYPNLSDVPGAEIHQPLSAGTDMLEWVSANRMLKVSREAATTCTKSGSRVSVNVAWDVTPKGIQQVELWLKDFEDGRKLWSLGEKSGKLVTGQWMRDGSQVIVVDPAIPAEVARITLNGLACAE